MPPPHPHEHPAHCVAAQNACHREDGRDLDVVAPCHLVAVCGKHHGSDAQRHAKADGDAGELFQQTVEA